MLPGHRREGAVEVSGRARFHELQLQSQRGELWLASANAQDKAERCFPNAVALGIDQKSRRWEFRATSSLGKL